MGFKFRKRIKIAPGLHVNISKSGVSTSIGKPGATVNIGKKGVNATVGIPGSGLSYSQNLSKSNSFNENNSQTEKGSSHFGKVLAVIVTFFLAVNFFSSPSKPAVSLSTVEAKSLRVRAEATLNSKVINQLVVGDKVVVLKTNGSWALVEGNGVKGWVASEYLSSPRS
ncbi:DUF4236 domain-containing protein [Photobacterium damselae]|uniref:DUF4236 domain-containing protein n=1 Tax=Photobacterium damselae TaxID=38293 RepID=UPI0010FD4C62|nr:DUF4236 domain-containing protein [Photobacterium damselae]KAB1512028.1 DUF4236 domain-containing protein [Photobacterium damselae subsp. damselae]TLS67752.1 DUF4236 domain-containing protein [Photobacterium damselae subsp. damselae]TLS76750.1 DUF4236 domain-containing protein [Photobacterium damselae subsp. damselae]TLS84521.1 DUF4236 domain-containing protein [Photobacterium damselae subsp. damselae]